MFRLPIHFSRIQNFRMPAVRAYIWPSDDHTNIDTFVPNYRWTPIISDIVIPFSILLEIPGLTEHWYIRTEGNKTVQTRTNPVILDIGLGFSVACALVANACLVLRFLEKRVQTVTLSCIVFLTIHGECKLVCSLASSLTRSQISSTLLL